MYEFKTRDELIWFVLTTVVGTVASAIAIQGTVAPTDWRAFAIGIASALVRTLAGGLLSLKGDTNATS